MNRVQDANDFEIVTKIERVDGVTVKTYSNLRESLERRRLNKQRSDPAARAFAAEARKRLKRRKASRIARKSRKRNRKSNQH